MDLRHTIGEYVIQGRELFQRLRSSEEGPTATVVDLHILRVEMFLIDNAAANLQEFIRQHPSKTTTTEVDEEMPRLEEPSLPPIIPSMILPAEPV